MNKPQNKNKAQIKREIIEFLNRTSGQADKKPGRYGCGMIHKNSLVLATTYKDVPRATPLEFFNEKITIYIFGEPGGKIANLKRNSRICAAVYEQPLKHSKSQKSLQIFGTAELISMRSNPRLFKAKAQKWNLYSVLESFLKAQFKGKEISKKDKKALADRFLSSINMIKITPDHIILREYHPDFTMPKYEWKKQEKRLRP
jgi:nitroimidazol reductase NimA-like FMN-containing flavoprotein (pyridoxamine 5'-phosphate oxidase superfamily)